MPYSNQQSNNPKYSKTANFKLFRLSNSSPPRPYGHVIFSGNSAIWKGQLLFLFPFPFWCSVFLYLLVFSPCFVCFIFIKCPTCTRGGWTAVMWLFLTNEIRRSKCSWIGRHENRIRPFALRGHATLYYENEVTWFSLRKTIGGLYLKQNKSDFVFQTRTIFLKWVSS